MGDLHLLLDLDFGSDGKIVNVYSKDFYDMVKEFMDRHKVRVETMYKAVAKKVKPVALPLLLDCKEKVETAPMQPNLRDPRKTGHGYVNIRWI